MREPVLQDGDEMSVLNLTSGCVPFIPCEPASTFCDVVGERTEDFDCDRTPDVNQTFG